MGWWRRVVNVLRPGRHSRELDAELAFHLAEATDRLIEQGLPREVALREARRRFGFRPRVKDHSREQGIVLWLESLVADLRYGLRALRATPGFTTVAVLSIGLGIGANAAIFSLIDALVLRTLPVPHPERLVKVAMGESDNDVFTNPLWEAIRDQGSIFDGVLAYGSDRFNLSTSGEARLVDGAFVSGGFFHTLGVQAAVGRALQPMDDTRGCPAVAVVSHSFWQTAYGGKPDVIGATLPINGHPFTVIGALSAGFTGVEIGRAPAIFLPICAEPLAKGGASWLDERSTWWLQIIGRLPVGASQEALSARLAGVSPGIFQSTLPADWGKQGQQQYLRRRLMAYPATNGLSDARGRYELALVVLMGVVGVVLLIACANVANLLLARAAARQREFAMRLAIGGSRGRIIRQVLTESLLLSAIGALVGLLLARWGSTAIVSLLARRSDALYLDLALDGRVLGFTLAVAVGTGLLFGVAPALRSVRLNPQDVLKVGGAGMTGGVRALTAGKALVIAQVALSLVLVVTAGLLLGTFRTLATMSPGFQPEGLVLAEVNYDPLNITAAEKQAATSLMLEELRQTPGVVAASASALTPVSGRGWNSFVFTTGYQPASKDDNLVWFNGITDHYFTTMGTALIGGRDLTSRDGPAGPRVAIINQSAARKFFGAASPIGRQIYVQNGDRPEPPMEIVGVVEDARYRSLRDSNTATVYVPLDPSQFNAVFEVRSHLGARGAKEAILGAQRLAIPDASVQVATMTEQLSESLLKERLMASLSAAFGVLALSLALIGLYGTMAYNVTRRRKEIGIRVALGATRARVLGLVTGEVGRMVLLGLALGGLATLATTRFLTSLLYGRSPLDPGTLAVSTVAVGLVAIAAGILPGFRAAGQDPQAALREE